MSDLWEQTLEKAPVPPIIRYTASAQWMAVWEGQMSLRQDCILLQHLVLAFHCHFQGFLLAAKL